ncbi:TPA: SDR family NAD(P)-dependent oxidoreductase [Kluyvera cryocrescens]|uniref:SDR family NAD(P)-dependent oxidoreductase n=1 Tax=Kluyvera cryocrescens TaxID=580 RepID=UPI0028BE1B6B|nr:SDR family NAD(P)-dependent oxidoreductase [Kluyvera cryocrescens]WNN71161.1 SDR family NAD(P)-dependent oxidoreductase [Kluyvera cryocrescens]HED1542536.1 SDR family NAD(P)-dependent oxidoreductase [Kluyvera cryocrescens]
MHSKTLLLIGASRGLGHAMAETFVQRGWKVIGTVRDSAQHTPLHALAGEYPQQVHIEQLDICESPQITALSQRLSGQTIDMLFVNAGTTNRDPSQTIGEISTDEFMQIMLTNALSPMRVIEQFAAQVTAGGLIGVMSSGQGSIANNESGQRELYRGSKAALNMFMRSLAARPTMKARPLVTMAPGWIKTALGGSDAPYTIEETIPLLVNVLLEKQQRPGLEYLDFRGNTVPW